MQIGTQEAEFVVGWLGEPAIVDQSNAVQLIVSVEGEHGEERPVLGLDKVLKVEITTGGRSITLDLRPAFGLPGEYRARLIPTVPGTYVFRFFGNINGTNLNETFDCSKGQFNCVGVAGDIQFPEKTLSGRETKVALDDIRSQVSNLSNDIASLGRDLRSISGAIQNAYTAAVVGVIVGVIGIVFGIVAMLRSRKKAQ